MFVRPLTLIFSNFFISFGVLVSCRLLKENCGLNVEDAKKLKKDIFGARIKRSTLPLKLRNLTLKCTCARAWTPLHEGNCIIEDLKPMRVQLTASSVRSSALI
jgi:hypothetical protein